MDEDFSVLDFADGSQVSYDAGGMPVSITQADGSVQGIGSAIVDQARDLFNFGARAWISRETSPTFSTQVIPPQQPGTAAANAVPGWRKYVPIVLLALGGAALYRVLR